MVSEKLTADGDVISCAIVRTQLAKSAGTREGGIGRFSHAVRSAHMSSMSSMAGGETSARAVGVAAGVGAASAVTSPTSVARRHGRATRSVWRRPGLIEVIQCRPRSRKGAKVGGRTGGTRAAQEDGASAALAAAWSRQGETRAMSMLDDVHKELVTAIGKAHDALKREVAKLRAGRANTALLDSIRVDYYGTMTPLSQMANVSVPEARLLTVKPWDKSAVKAVEKAIREADLGLNPQADGDLIRIPIPPLTEERRKEFVKIARKYGEECKVTIRKARHEALNMLQELDSEGEASADDVDRAKKKAEEAIADGTKQVDAIISHKEKDILEV
jgi:ribosome recycling factor